MHGSRLGVVVATGLVLLTSCTGGEEQADTSPTERLATAKEQIDDAASIDINLATKSLPTGVDGVTRASGTGNHDPAFEGTIDIVASGFAGEAPVVAVDDTVYVQLPFTSRYVTVDPTAYGAPDPARLLASDGGLSSLLTEATEVSEDGRRRSGEEVLTEVTGTVPGEVMSGLFPTADEQGSFDVTFTLDDSDALSTATLTGPFYSGADEVTYDVEIETSDKPVRITKP